MSGATRIATLNAFTRTVPAAAHPPVARSGRDYLSPLRQFVMFGLRLVLSFSRHGPVSVDEIGYLANARVSTGAPPIDLSTTTFYRGGYSLFLAPAVFLSHDPTTSYRIALTIGAAISALVFPLAYAVVRDLGQARRVAFGAALVASVAPDAVFPSAYTMSEVLLAPLVVAWIWCTMRTARADVPVPRPRWMGWSGGAVHGPALCHHVRGTVLVALGVLALFVATRVSGWRPALVGVAVATGGIAAAWSFDSWLQRRNWPGGAAAVGVHGDLLSGHGLARTAGVAIGQLWYVTVASACLAPLGLMWAVSTIGAFTGPDRIRRMVVAGLSLGSVLAIAVGVAAVAGDPPTSNWYVYGRYAAAAMPLPVALGVVCLVDRTTPMRRLLIAVSAAIVPTLLLIVRLYGGRRIDVPNAFAPAVPTIVVMARPFTSASPSVLKIGLASVVALAVSRWWSVWWRRPGVERRWPYWPPRRSARSVAAASVISQPDDRAALPQGTTGAEVTAMRASERLGLGRTSGLDHVEAQIRLLRKGHVADLRWRGRRSTERRRHRRESSVVERCRLRVPIRGPDTGLARGGVGEALGTGLGRTRE